MINLDHPRYGIDVWEVESNEEAEIAKRQGYVEKGLLRAAPDLLAACESFVEAWEKCLQLEKTDVALRMAKEAIVKARD